MLDETKVVETNFKGNISLSNELIEKVVFKLVIKHLTLLMNSNLNIFNFNVVLVFE